MNNASDLLSDEKFAHEIFEFPLPYNFDSNKQEFDIFKNLSSQAGQNSLIKTYKNVNIAANSVVFNYFNIFRETCISEEAYRKYKTGYKFFFKYVFPQINFNPNKRFILITDEWTTNYYHWHLIALHRLLLLKQHNLIQDSILLLPKRYKKLKFIFESLTKFGIKENQIVFLRKKSHIKIKELLFPLTHQNDPIAFREIKKVLIEKVEKGINLGDKIYISRDGCQLRFIENEGDFITLVEKYGFKKVLMEEYSYQDQISICNNAKYIIGPHGAGFTNVLFMKDGGFLLELAAKPDDLKSTTHYHKLSCFTGINYLYQECEARGKIPDFHQGSLFVDLNKLEKNLQLMLKKYV